MEYNFLIFNSISIYSFIEHFLIFIDLFLRTSFNLFMVSRIIFPGVSATVCFSIIMLLPKKTILIKKKLTKQRKYNNDQKANPIIYILRQSVDDFSNPII